MKSKEQPHEAKIVDLTPGKELDKSQKILTIQEIFYQSMKDLDILLSDSLGKNHK